MSGGGESDQWSVISDQWSVHGKVSLGGRGFRRTESGSIQLTEAGVLGAERNGYGGERWRAEAHPTEEEVEVGHRERGVGERAIASGLKRLYVHSFCECGRIRAA